MVNNNKRRSDQPPGAKRSKPAKSAAEQLTYASFMKHIKDLKIYTDEDVYYRSAKEPEGPLVLRRP